MKFAILAAGEGSRLASEGVAKPKPLVELQGIPLIERLIRIFARNGASSINIIVNEQQPETVGFIKSLEVGCPINIVIKSTPSSMHSMHALSHLLRGEKFCLTTVDTLFREDEFANYIKKFEEYEGDGIMAVTDYIDDEKPLYRREYGDNRILRQANTRDTLYLRRNIWFIAKSPRYSRQVHERRNTPHAQFPTQAC